MVVPVQPRVGGLDLGLGQLSCSSPVPRGHWAPVLFQPLEGSRDGSWKGVARGTSEPWGPQEGLLGCLLPCGSCWPPPPQAPLPGYPARDTLLSGQAAQDFVLLHVLDL